MRGDIHGELTFDQLARLPVFAPFDTASDAVVLPVDVADRGPSFWSVKGKMYASA